MAKKFIDLTGIEHVWSKIKTALNGKANVDLSNVTDDAFRNKANAGGVGGVPVVTASSSDGVTYTATVAGVTALTTGLTITIIPSVVSTSISAKLNINSLGDKYIRQSTTNNTATGLTPKNAGWMAANKPITIQYDGTQWKTIAARSNASDLNGTVAIANGGTGGEKFIKDASISGKVITLTYSDGTTETLTTQDTVVDTSALGAANKLPYATCSTGVSTTAKVATISNGVSFSLVVGAVCAIKFSNAVDGNKTSSPTLNVNSTGAKSLKSPTGSWKTESYGDDSGSERTLYAGVTICVYDGSAWNVVNHVNEN